MKKLILAIFFAIAFINVSAKANEVNFSIMDDLGIERIFADTTINVANPHAEIVLAFYLNNLSETNAVSVTGMVEVVKITDEPSYYIYCFDQCYAGHFRTNSELKGPINIAGNSFQQLSFDFYPDGAEGKSIFKYNVYNASTNELLKTLTITINVGTNNVFEQTEKFSKLFPSINGGEFRIENEFISQTTKCKIYSYTGEILNASSVFSNGLAQINALNLSNGEYFIELYNDEKIFANHKFIISK